MALPFAFSALTTPNLSMLDADFAALGVLTPIHCTASGTNTIVLTPVTDTPTVAAYVNQMQFTAVAAGTNSTAVTVQVGSLAALNVYKAAPGGAVALSGNELVSGLAFVAMYQSALNSGAGGFLLVNPVPSTESLSGQSQGAIKRLTITVTSNTALTVLAESVVVSNGVTAYNTVLNVNKTLGTGSTGLLGLDTGSVGSNDWYAVYVIFNPSTLASSAVLSTSFTAPSQANTAGYTQYAYVGAVRVDGSSNLYRTIQKGKRGQYVVTGGTNTTRLREMAAITGVTTTGGGVDAPTWASVAVAAFVPDNAERIIIALHTDAQGNNDAAIAAPNNAYGTPNGNSNPPPVSSGTRNTLSITSVAFAEFVLESANIYWAAQGNNAASYQSLNCFGWVDS